jgi:hypothetical protein
LRMIAACVIALVIVVSFFAGCASTSFQQSESNEESALNNKKVALVFDSAIPVIMQPDINTIVNILENHKIHVVLIDMANNDYQDIKTFVDTSQPSGLVMCLPYSYEVERYLNGIHTTDFYIMQFGGDYYSNNISVSINSTYVGYIIGKKMGELFLEKGIASPKIGFYSIEWEWKIIEQGFIEGLRERTPEAYITGRKIYLMDGKTIIGSGEDDFEELDGVGVFYCDTESQLLSYAEDIFQARVGTGEPYRRTENLAISLRIEDNGVSLEALNQFAEMLDGNQTTRSDFQYDAIFEFVVF